MLTFINWLAIKEYTIDNNLSTKEVDTSKIGDYYFNWARNFCNNIPNMLMYEHHTCPKKICHICFLQSKLKEYKDEYNN